MRLHAFAVSLFVVAVFAGCSGSGDDDVTDVLPPSLSRVVDCTIGNTTWSEPCLALASPNDSPSKTEIDIAVNPRDPLNVFVASKDLDRAASDCVWAVGQVTHDGGKTWKTTYVGGTRDQRSPGDLLYGWECITDPILAWAPDGTLYYSLQTYAFNPFGLPYAPLPVGTSVPPEFGIMVVAVSRDGGDSFSELIPMHVGDEVAIFHDYMRMTANPRTGTIYTIWNQITGLAASIPVVVSYSGGPAANLPWYFVTPDQPTGTGESGIVAGNDGTVYALLAGFNSPGVGYLSVSDDDGMTYSIPAEVFTFEPMGDLEGAQYRSGTSVEMAIDNSGGDNEGCLYIAWPDGSDDVADILSRRSCDGGATWSDAVTVHGASADGQWMPRVSVDAGGRVWVVYYTRAYDPAHHLIDAEVAWSDDGGESWSNQRLTTQSFDGNLGIHQNGFPFIGDYIGIASVGKDTYVGFPTTVTGRAEIAVAHLVNDSIDPSCGHGTAHAGASDDPFPACPPT